MFEDGEVGFGFTPIPFDFDFLTVTAATGGLDHELIGEMVMVRPAVNPLSGHTENLEEM